MKLLQRAYILLFDKNFLVNASKWLYNKIDFEILIYIFEMLIYIQVNDYTTK